MQHKKVMFHFAAVLLVLIFLSVGASAQPPKRTPFKKGYSIACFVLSLSLFFSGCVTTSAQLQELERQASVIQPTTGREARRSIHDTHLVASLPRPSRLTPHVSRFMVGKKIFALGVALFLSMRHSNTAIIQSQCVDTFLSLQAKTLYVSV